MQAFLSIYGFADWLLRGVAVATQTLLVGGVAYLALTVSVLRQDTDETRALERFCRRVLAWSALTLGVVQLLAAGALTTFLTGSTQADLATAASADAVILRLASAGAAFAVAYAVQSAPANIGLMLFLSALILATHSGVTHAASRAEPSAALLAAEFLHLAALGAWLGGVPYFIASLRKLRLREERVSLSRRFSAVALMSVPVMIATGVFMSVPYVGTVERLYQTNYGLLLGSKAALLTVLLCMGAANFFAIRRLRRGQSTAFQTAPVLGETEIAVGLIAIFCAAALATSPLAADTRAARPSVSEISGRFDLVTPRLAIPTQPPAIVSQTATASSDAPAAATAPEPERTLLDIAWSETHHHYAALFVILTGMVALVSQSGRMRPLTRHWPALFLGLAVYLFIVADEDAWPLGQIGFFESLADPRIAQHKLMIALVAGLALFEWRAQSGRDRSAWPSLAFPVTIAAASAFLLTHYGHTGSKEEVLIEISHMPVALLGVIAAIARWLELRLPPSTLARGAALVWPTAFIAAGAFLMLYRETV